MNPIELPGPGAKPEEVIAFLAHQLQQMRLHVERAEQTETQIALRVQAHFDASLAEVRSVYAKKELTFENGEAVRALQEKVAGYERDAQRYRLVRQYTVKLRKFGISAKGLELDDALDRVAREANH